MKWFNRRPQDGKQCPVCKDIYTGNHDHHMRRKCPKRDYCCKKCGKEGTYESITGSHVKECGSERVKCGLCNKCRERGTMEEHKSKYCEYAQMECPVLNCEKKVMRKDINQHLKRNTSAHRKAIEKKVREASTASNAKVSTKTDNARAPPAFVVGGHSRQTSSATSKSQEMSGYSDNQLQEIELSKRDETQL